jgi:lipopolysaccharide exporter
MSSALGHRIAKSAAWMVGSRMVMRGIGLFSTIILARLLRPEDFGLVALAMALVTAMEVFGNFSFDLALIRDGRASREHYDTVWTMTIIRGALVGAALLALARPAAAFFSDPRVEPIVYCFAVVTFLEGLQNVGTVDFRKELAFHREFAFQVAAKLITFVTTITCAFVWREYWALVVGIVVGKIANVFLSYGMHPYRPRLDLSEWRSLVSFSKWLLASNISNFLSGRLDTFAVGRVVGAHAVGLYEVANEIANLPTGELIWPIQRALFPGYAKLQGDRDQLATGYIGGLAIITMIALPAAFGIAATAPLIIEVFLGPGWVEALPLLQVLAIAGILKVGYANSYTVLLALGRAKLLSHLATLNLIFFAAFVVAGTVIWGSIGTAFASVITSAIMLTIYVAITLRVLGTPFRTLVASVWRSVAAALAMAFFLHILTPLWPWGDGELPAIAELLASFAIGAVTYVVSHFVLWRLAGSPPGAEKEALTVVVPLIFRSRSRQGATEGPGTN